MVISISEFDVFFICYSTVRISVLTIYTGRGRKHAQAGGVVIPDGKTRRKYRIQFFSYDVSFFFLRKSSSTIDRVYLNVANFGVPDWARLDNRQDVVPRVKVSEDALSPRGTRLKMCHTPVLDQFLAKRVQTLFSWKWNLIGRTLFHVFSRRIFCRTLIHIWSVIDQVQVYLTNFQTRFSRW